MEISRKNAFYNDFTSIHRHEWKDLCMEGIFDEMEVNGNLWMSEETFCSRMLGNEIFFLNSFILIQFIAVSIAFLEIKRI